MWGGDHSGISVDTGGMLACRVLADFIYCRVFSIMLVMRWGGEVVLAVDTEWVGERSVSPAGL